VFFLTDHGVEPSFDPGYGRAVRYDLPLLEGYSYEMVPNRSPKPSPSTPWGTVNPSLVGAVRKASLDVLLVHGYSYVSAWIAFGTAFASRLPYLLRGESRPDAGGHAAATVAVKRLILRPLVRHAGACLAVGQQNRQFYLDYGAPSKRIFDAPYSVDTERFERDGDIGRAARNERLEALGLDPTKPVVLFAAKFQPWKRPLDLVGATDQLAGRVNLVFVGDGPLRSNLERLAETRPHMRVLGFANQSEIGKWYGTADLFVLPSAHEPWGLAVNEAMAAGAIPIVSDAVGCAPDLVPPEIGWVYKAGDVGMLARSLGEACQAEDLELRRRLARARVHQWGLPATARGIEEAVSKVAKQ